MRIKDIPRVYWVAAAALVIGIVAAAVLSGCNTGELPFARSQARQKAARIADRKQELQELTAEWEELTAEAEADPVPEKVEKAKAAQVVVVEHAKETARQVRQLNELLAAIQDSEAVVKETTDQAKEAAQYLPEPWRSIALMAGTFGLTLWRGKGTAKVLSDRARADERAVGLSLVKSIDAVGLTPEQREKIRQGPLARALVDEAQGKL